MACFLRPLTSPSTTSCLLGIRRSRANGGRNPIATASFGRVTSSSLRSWKILHGVAASIRHWIQVPPMPSPRMAGSSDASLAVGWVSFSVHLRQGELAPCRPLKRVVLKSTSMASLPTCRSSGRMRGHVPRLQMAALRPRMVALLENSRMGEGGETCSRFRYGSHAWTAPPDQEVPAHPLENGSSGASRTTMLVSRSQTGQALVTMCGPHKRKTRR